MEPIVIVAEDMIPTSTRALPVVVMLSTVVAVLVAAVVVAGVVSAT